MAERYPIYALADITVQSRDVPHDTMCDDVIAAVIAHFDRLTETSP
jgi:shikimate kinase